MAPGIFNLFAYTNEGHAEPQELDRNTLRPNHAFVDRCDGWGPITVLGIDFRVQSPVFPELLKVFCFHACLVLISVYARAVQYLLVKKRPNLAPVLLTLSVLPVSSTDSTRLRLLFELPNPTFRSLHLLDGSGQFPFGADPPLADPAENREQADNGQQINCNHFLRLLSNLVCNLRTSTQSSCRIQYGRDSRLCCPRAICMVVFFNLRA